jgi:hypothetical protein
VSDYKKAQNEEPETMDSSATYRRSKEMFDCKKGEIGDKDVYNP